METGNEKKKITGELTGIFRKQGSAIWHLPETAGRYQLKVWSMAPAPLLKVSGCTSPTGERILEVLVNRCLFFPENPALGSQSRLVAGGRDAEVPSQAAAPCSEQRPHQRVRPLTRDDSVSPKLGDCHWRLLKKQTKTQEAESARCFDSAELRSFQPRLPRRAGCLQAPGHGSDSRTQRQRWPTAGLLRTTPGWLWRGERGRHRAAPERPFCSSSPAVSPLRRRSSADLLYSGVSSDPSLATSRDKGNSQQTHSATLPPSFPFPPPPAF